MAAESSDLLSNVFRRARPWNWTIGKLDLTVPWNFRVDGGLAAFYCVVQGRCRLEIGSIDTEINLASGDLAVVTPGRGHGLFAGYDGDASRKGKFRASKLALRTTAGKSPKNSPFLTRLVRGSVRFDNGERGFLGWIGFRPASSSRGWTA